MSTLHYAHYFIYCQSFEWLFLGNVTQIRPFRIPAYFFLKNLSQEIWIIRIVLLPQTRTSKNVFACSNRTSPAQHVATEHRSSTDTSFIYCQSSTNVRVVTMEPAPRETDRSIDARHLQTSPNGGEHNRTSPYKLSAKRLIRACQCHGHRAWRTTFP